MKSGRAGSSQRIALATFVALAATVAATAYTVTGATAGGVGERGDSTAQIVITEQATDQIIVLESDQESWSTAKTVWKWKPTAANGLGDLVVNWGLPDEAKLRHRGDQAYLLTTDSYGLAAVVPYPQGTPAYWATDAGRANNPHSIELLPDGNVAVAASNGAYVRVYAASQGPRETSYVQYQLKGAHGVYWDERSELLWAIGDDHLVALTVGGSASVPTLTEARKVVLPTKYGHDLQPVATDPDRLWLTTNAGVYQYSIGSGRFHTDYPAADRINVAAVKSVGEERMSGQVLTSNVQKGNICSWCTDTAGLHRRSDQLVLRGAQIYKSRWWVDPNRD